VHLGLNEITALRIFLLLGEEICWRGFMIWEMRKLIPF
jgi:hypothetical protein